MYDIVILGGGIAGWAAAAFAARLGRSVGVVSRGNEPTDATFWLQPAAAPLLAAADVAVDKLALTPFTGVTFWNADLSRHVECKDVPAMSLVERDGLRTALRESALRGGAKQERACEIIEVKAGEDAVRLRTGDDRLIEGRLLIAADGANSLAVRTLRLAPPDPAPFACTQWRSKPRKGEARSSKGELHVLLATQGPLGFASIMLAEHANSMRLSEPGGGDDVARRSESLLKTCAARSDFAGLQTKSGKSVTGAVPRGAALDYDTHVGKRTLVIGEAGGFVAALSQDGLYPALVVAQLAAEVAHAALAARHVQDDLGQFDARWRAALADQLRLPGTDLKFLLPLVFTNSSIAQRMARAFLLGENM